MIRRIEWAGSHHSGMVWLLSVFSLGAACSGGDNGAADARESDAGSGDAAPGCPTSILFRSGQEIALMDPDGMVRPPQGADRRTLIEVPASNKFAEWSPDGTRIVFDLDSKPYIMNADGKSVRALSDDMVADTVRWSPDGMRLAYVAINPEVAASVGEVIVIDADGSDRKVLVEPTSTTAGPDTDRNLAWSPDGLWLAVRYYDGQQYYLGLVSAGGAPGKVVSSDVAPFKFYWSPDGEAIAFLKDGAVFTVAPESPPGTSIFRGDPLQLLGWTPGNQILFLVELQLEVMDRDGAQPTTLVNVSDTEEIDGAVSSDGSRLATVARNMGDEGAGDIWVSRVDGSMGRSLTFDNISYRPRWRPCP